MIDQLKIHSLPANAPNLLNNGLLTFTLSNVTRDGELLNRWQVAYYESMTFKVKGTNSRLEGSLHKHKQGGENWKDYKLSDIQDTIQELSENFDFDPDKSLVNFIEIGVNIPLDYDPSKLIECLVLYRTTPFDRMRVSGKGFGKVAETNDFDIKIYNKSLQYGLPENLLRFEIKVKRMRFLERYGINGLNLADLTKPEMYPKFKAMLLDIVSGILIYNPDINPDNLTTFQDRELLKFGQFAEYWNRLDRRRRNEKINRFKEIAGTNEIIETLKCKISDKWEILSKPDIIPTFQKELTEQEKDKNGHYPLSIKGEYVRTCKVTGLPIYNQKTGSKYITSKGVKWYYENNPETYTNSLETLLTDKWITKHCGEPMEAYFIEIYHQIRNKALNPKNNIKRDYLNCESKGLKLFLTVELMTPAKFKLIKNECLNY